MREKGLGGLFGTRSRISQRWGNAGIKSQPTQSAWEGKKDGGSTRKRISPPLPKIKLCADPHWGPALPGRCEKCKSQQPDSRTACVITVATQPGMLPSLRTARRPSAGLGMRGHGENPTAGPVLVGGFAGSEPGGGAGGAGAAAFRKLGWVMNGSRAAAWPRHAHRRGNRRTGRRHTRGTIAPQ